MINTHAHDIIVNVLTSTEFNTCIQKINPADLRNDLIGEVALILLETKPDKIVNLHNESKLTFFVVRIIINLAFSNTSPFYTKYRKNVFVPLDKAVNFITDNSAEDIERRQRRENLLTLIDSVKDYGDVIPGLDEYESMMLKLYLTYGTYRAMAKQTLIPQVSCHHTVKKAVNKLKQNLKI